MESDSDTKNSRLDDLAEEFVARYRDGHRPSLTEFIARNPDLADEIRDLFPTLAVMEEARVDLTNPADNITSPKNMGVPERIGEYRILREVGRGGMGIVYEAVQESLGRHVALKILPTHSLLDPRQLQRFQREARSAARLHHTNIVPVFGVGEYEGLNFYAMQFIRGLGLDQVVSKLKSDSNHAAIDDSISSALVSSIFPRPAKDSNSSLSDTGYAYWLGVARVGTQVADALAYANSQGVLHRDIKPSNLLLDNDGTVWVTDFGLAKDTLAENSPNGVEQSNLTETGDIVGTLRYLAPERLKGHSDPRSDIYSLGATLYELLTLRPAFEDSDRSVFLRRLLHEEPRRPRSIDPSIPIDLETIVVKAMAKEPEDRYRSASELAEDLRCFLADRPIRARRISAWERAWRTCRRNPLLTSLSLMVVLLIATLTIGFQVAGWIRVERDRAIRNADLAQEAEQNAQQSLRRALEAEKDAKIRAHLTQAVVLRKRDLQGRRVLAVREIEQALSLAPSNSIKRELRNELIATLAMTDTMPAQVWASPHGIFAVDHQFNRYARQSRDGKISIRQIQNDHELCQLQRPSGPDSRACLKFSPDGRYLASFTFDQHVMVWQIDEERLVLDDFGCCWEFAFDFTPDSQAIVAGHDREMVVLDLSTNRVRSRWPIAFAPWCVSCGPTEDYVAITPEGQDPLKKLQVFSWSTTKLIAEHIAPEWVFDVAWHPNGRSLAYGCGDMHVYFWNVQDSRPYLKLASNLAHGVRVAFSHDGSLLASSTWGHEFRLWDTKTGELLCSARHVMLCLQFSPDDRQIALFQSGSEIGTYEIIRSDIFRNIIRGGSAEENNRLLNAAFSSDGKLLMVGTERGIRFHEYPSGDERSFAPIGRVAYLHVDGKDNLHTAGRSLLRWPIKKLDDAANQFSVGPPDQMPMSVPSEFGVSRDGRVFVIANYDGAIIFHLDQPDKPVVLSPHEDCRYVAISRDGKWAATASHFGSKVKVWDSFSGVLLATLPVESSSWVRFSPDGRWLATPDGARNLWRAGTWEAGPKMGGMIAGFSEDGRWMALDDLAGSAHLVDPDTSQEYMRLEHPYGYGADRYFFTPDGTELVAVGTARPSGFAWNLQRIREQLSARHLDWDLPPFPSHFDSQEILPIEVKLQSNETQPKSREEVVRERIARCRVTLDANPDDAATCNELAWVLLFSPSQLRDSAEALRLASHAMSMAPDNANYRNTLGVAYYREGRYREATDCLSKNLTSQQDDGLPFDLYFLAMSHFQLGDQERGRELLVWADRWTEELASRNELSAGYREELESIQQEAEMLLSR